MPTFLIELLKNVAIPIALLIWIRIQDIKEKEYLQKKIADIEAAQEAERREAQERLLDCLEFRFTDLEQRLGLPPETAETRTYSRAENKKQLQRPKSAAGDTQKRKNYNDTDKVRIITPPPQKQPKQEVHE
jgi:hypothetical protein